MPHRLIDWLIERFPPSKEAVIRTIDARGYHRSVFLDDGFQEAVVHTPALANALIDLAKSEHLLDTLVADDAVARAAVHLNADIVFEAPEEIVKRVALDERMWAHLREQVDLRAQRLASDPENLRRLLEHPDVWAALRGELAATTAGFMRETSIQDAVLADAEAMRRFMRRGGVLEHAINDDEFAQRLLADKRTLGRILDDENLLDRILERGKTLPRILANSDLLDKIAGNNAAFESVAGNDALVRKLLGRGHTQQLILDDAEVLGKVLENKAAFEHILGDDAYLDRLLEKGRTFERILTNPPLLGKILENKAAFEHILGDDAYLDRLLEKGHTFERALETPAFLHKLLGNREVVRRQLESDALSAVLVAHPKMHSRVFEHAPLRDAVLYDERVYHEPLFSTVRARVEFEAAWKRLAPWLPESVRNDHDAVASARQRVGAVEDVPEAP
jgi:hypothetical protein